MHELCHTATRTVRRPRRGVAHAGAGGRVRAVTVRALIARAARALAGARLHFGHGTDNARDEAAALVLHAARLPHGEPSVYARRLGAAAQRRALELLRRRIDSRVPAAYLTGVSWFAGVALKVDARVLVPRSPIAELIERGFAPWVDARRVRRVLDLGTGSGCIAIACARALTQARIDAVDISEAALEVARENVRRHRLTRRVRLMKSDHFSALG